MFTPDTDTKINIHSLARGQKFISGWQESATTEPRNINSLTIILVLAEQLT